MSNIGTSPQEVTKGHTEGIQRKETSIRTINVKTMLQSDRSRTSIPSQTIHSTFGYEIT